MVRTVQILEASAVPDPAAIEFKMQAIALLRKQISELEEQPLYNGDPVTHLVHGHRVKVFSSPIGLKPSQAKIQIPPLVN